MRRQPKKRFSPPRALPSLRTSAAVHRCQDAVLDDGSKRDRVGLAVKPSVRISLDLVRIAEPKINLSNGVARSKVATPRARMNPKAAITLGVTGTSNAFVPCAPPLSAHPLTDLPAYLSSEYHGRAGRRKQSQRHCAHRCHEHKRRQQNFRPDIHGCIPFRGDLIGRFASSANENGCCCANLACLRRIRIGSGVLDGSGAEPRCSSHRRKLDCESTRPVVLVEIDPLVDRVRLVLSRAEGHRRNAVADHPVCI
jgi:hypothetical protein